MKNNERHERMRWAAWDGAEDMMVRFSVLIAVVIVLALVQRDASLLTLGWVTWFGVYLLVAPFVVMRVAGRDPPGDRWRTAAWLAYGGAPAPLFFVPGAVGWPWGFATLSIALVWGIATWLLALRDAPPPMPHRARAVMMAGASLIVGLVSLPLFAGAVIGIAMGVWNPPAIAWLATPVIVGLCLPLAICAAYASVKLLAEARRAMRLAADPAAP